MLRTYVRGNGNTTQAREASGSSPPPARGGRSDQAHRDPSGGLAIERPLVDQGHRAHGRAAATRDMGARSPESKSTGSTRSTSPGAVFEVTRSITSQPQAAA